MLLKEEHKTTRYFIYGQSSLFLSVAFCVLLLPQGLFANDGISYYSAQRLTIIPYSIGLLSIAWFSYKLAQSLPKGSHPVLKTGFNTISIILLLLVATPYGINFTIEYIHTLISAALFLVQFLIMWWLALRVRSDAINLFLLFLMAMEMIVTVMYLNPKAGYLIVGELSFQLTFAFAAYRTIDHILNRQRGREIASRS